MKKGQMFLSDVNKKLAAEVFSSCGVGGGDGVSGSSDTIETDLRKPRLVLNNSNGSIYKEIEL